VGDARLERVESVLAAARLGVEKEKGRSRVSRRRTLEREDLLLAILGWYVIILISEYDYDGGGSVAAVMAATGP